MESCFINLKCVQWFLKCDLLLYKYSKKKKCMRGSCLFLMFTLLQGWFNWCLHFTDACSPALYCLKSKSVYLLFSQAVVFVTSTSHLCERFVEQLACNILKNEPHNKRYAFAKKRPNLKCCLSVIPVVTEKVLSVLKCPNSGSWCDL